MNALNMDQLYQSHKQAAIDYLKELSDNELEFIAHLDYGIESEKHLESLKSVIARDAEIIAKSENWFPYEVVELGANHLESGHEREFTGCILIVIINVINGNDSTKFLDEYMYDRSEIIATLPDHQRILIENLYFNQPNAATTSQSTKNA